jgi:hypothetical protein
VWAGHERLSSANEDRCYSAPTLSSDRTAFCYYRTFAEALKVGYACDEAGFFWYEDPYFEGGAVELGHRKLREFIKTPLLQGEKVASIQ